VINAALVAWKRADAHKARMAKASKLKVFRTAIGFHDAYVAAPSKKAALEAWGSTKDLFGRNAAEQVTDDKLTAEPLANPGKVIKRSRGTAAEQFAALPEDAPTLPKAKQTRKKPAPSKPRKPKPSRARLDAAETAIETAERNYEKKVADLLERQAALAREKRTLETDRRDEINRLERDRTKAGDEYDTAIADWDG